jgi:hypothetical protein
MSRSLDAMWKGALAGGIATLPMSGVMLAAEAAGLMGKRPPAVDPGRSRGLAAHVVYGAVLGELAGRRGRAA